MPTDHVEIRRLTSLMHKSGIRTVLVDTDGLLALVNDYDAAIRIRDDNADIAVRLIEDAADGWRGTGAAPIVTDSGRPLVTAQSRPGACRGRLMSAEGWEDAT
jgi:hypothetical protein